MLKQLKDDWNAWCYFNDLEGLGKQRMKFVWFQVRDWINSLVCLWKGHDWEDESYGGPDSGCMAGTCKRCGYSFCTWLY